MSYNNNENTQDVFEQGSISAWIGFIGLITIFFGIIGFLLVLINAVKEGLNVLLVVPLIGVPLVGLMFLAVSSVLDAVQETAENTRAMRKIMSD